MPAAKNPQQVAADLNVSIQDLNAVSTALGKPIDHAQVAAFIKQAQDRRVTINNAISAYQASGSQSPRPRSRPSASTPTAEPGLMTFEDLLNAAEDQSSQTDAATAAALAQAGSQYQLLDAVASLEMELRGDVMKQRIQGFVQEAAAHHFAIGSKQPDVQDDLYARFWEWVDANPIMRSLATIHRPDKQETIRRAIEIKSASWVQDIRGSGSMATTMATLPAALPSLPSAAPLQLTAS